MTTNQQRAAEVIYPWIDGNYGDQTESSEAAAQALADAGLLTPDLPEPNHADEDGALEWHIPDPDQPYPGIVRMYPNGHLRLVQINAPIKHSSTALALSRALAAAYAQTHHEKQ